MGWPDAPRVVMMDLCEGLERVMRRGRYFWTAATKSPQANWALFCFAVFAQPGPIPISNFFIFVGFVFLTLTQVTTPSNSLFRAAQQLGAKKATLTPSPISKQGSLSPTNADKNSKNKRPPINAAKVARRKKNKAFGAKDKKKKQNSKGGGKGRPGGVWGIGIGGGGPSKKRRRK